MVSFATKFVGKRWLHKGKYVKGIAETDSGNVKVALPSGEEIWTTFHQLHPIDGETKGFLILPLPVQRLAA